MAKKGKNAKLRAPASIPRKEHQQRITYMYKIGSMMQAKVAQQEQPSSDSFLTLSRWYLRGMDLVAKKSVSKLHPNIRRTVCKSCSRLQVPGVSCRVRLVNESKAQTASSEILQVSCVCGATKRYPIGKNPAYELFSDRPTVLYRPGQAPQDATQ